MFHVTDVTYVKINLDGNMTCSHRMQDAHGGVL